RRDLSASSSPQGEGGGGRSPRSETRAPTSGAGRQAHHAQEGVLARVYRAAAAPIIATRARALAFLVVVGLATLAALSLFAFRAGTVKLLPCDSKPEPQVVLDRPEGASLERTERTLLEAARRLEAIPEVVSIEAYAGTAAPFNFNGLVRHYYLRAAPELGDL